MRTVTILLPIDKMAYLKLTFTIYFLYTTLCLSYVGVKALEGIDFDYNKPEEWPNLYESCAGRRQSPISVSEHGATIPDLPPIVFKGMFDVPEKMTLQQTDNEVVLRVKYEKEPFTYSGGPLKGEYTFYDGVFHWGPTNGIGSEHAIDGKSASMGINFLGYKSEYGDPQTAAHKPDGLIGFSKLIEIDDDESKFNPALKALLPVLDEIRDPNVIGNVDPPFAIVEFMNDNDRVRNSKDFLVYNGSMLEPPCRENVLWFVITHPIYATQEFVDKFRNIRKQAYRPLQPQNGRNIYKITLKLN